MPSFRYQPGTGLCSDTSLKPQLTTHTPRTMQTSWFLQCALTNAHDRQPYVAAQLASCTHEKHERKQERVSNLPRGIQPGR